MKYSIQKVEGKTSQFIVMKGDKKVSAPAPYKVALKLIDKWSTETTMKYDLESVRQSILDNAGGMMSKRSDGTHWQTVCLDNVDCENRHVLAGILSDMTKKGEYEVIDSKFGMVKVGEE